VAVFHGTGVDVDCALGVLAASNVTDAALGPHADVIAAQSATRLAT
jgi:hypothetical protein